MVETKRIRVITLTAPSVVIADEDWESIRDANERLANYAHEIATLRNDLTARQLERDAAYRTLRGISSCSTCEVCRGAAMSALPQEAKHER